MKEKLVLLLNLLSELQENLENEDQARKIQEKIEKIVSELK